MLQLAKAQSKLMICPQLRAGLKHLLMEKPIDWHYSSHGNLNWEFWVVGKLLGPGALWNQLGAPD